MKKTQKSKTKITKETLKNWILNNKLLTVLIIIGVIGLLIIFILISSGGSSSESLEDKIGSSAELQAKILITLKYDVTGIVANTTRVRLVSENKYEVYGTVSVNDNYGTRHSGKFNGTCTVKSIDDIKCNVSVNL